MIATRYKNNFDVARGLGPGGNAVTITALEDAIKAVERWKAMLAAPGDVVIGATLGASCFGAPEQRGDHLGRRQVAAAPQARHPHPLGPGPT